MPGRSVTSAIARSERLLTTRGREAMMMRWMRPRCLALLAIAWSPIATAEARADSRRQADDDPDQAGIPRELHGGPPREDGVLHRRAGEGRRCGPPRPPARPPRGTRPGRRRRRARQPGGEGGPRAVRHPPEPGR